MYAPRPKIANRNFLVALPTIPEDDAEYMLNKDKIEKVIYKIPVISWLKLDLLLFLDNTFTSYFYILHSVGISFINEIFITAYK